MKNNTALSKDILEYENISLELTSLAVLVSCLGTDEVIEIADKSIRTNCYTLISDMISDRAKLVDEMFCELYKPKR